MAKTERDQQDQHKHHRKLRTFIHILIVVLIIAFCVYLYYMRDAWIPKLEGIGSQYSSSVTQNDGTLAEGNFPLTISSSSGYDVAQVSDTLFILYDSYVDVYSMHGDDEDSRQHAYQSAAMTSNDAYCLIYEQEGTSFRVDTKSKNIYTKTADEDIITGSVSDNGVVALVTESSSYTCSLVIYDDTGTRIYQRNCTDHVIDVIFHEDGDGCYYTTLDVVNGVVQSTVHSILFEEEETEWTADPLDTLVIQTEIASDGTLCVVGDSLCAYYSSTGDLQGEYAYTGTLVSASIENGRVGLIVEDDQQRETILVLLDQTAEEVEIVDLDESASYILVADNDALVMTDGCITAYDFTGDTVATVDLEDSYTSFLKQDGYIFLLGYNQIDRVDFKE